MIEEEWRVIDGYPAYAVSSKGRVKRVLAGSGTRPGVILRERLVWTGYRQVMLSNASRARRPWYVHVLVARQFLGSPHGLDVNHIDGDKGNNTLENLEYVTRSQNILHAIQIGLIKPRTDCPKGERHPNAKLSEAQAREIKEAAKSEPYEPIAGRYGVSVSLVGQIARGRAWQHLGPSSRTGFKRIRRFEVKPINATEHNAKYHSSRVNS